MLKKAIVTAAFIAVGTTFAFAQAGGGMGAGGAGGEPPRLDDAHPPGALKQGGIPPATAVRRDDYLAPAVQQRVQSKQVQGKEAQKNYRTRSVRGSRH
jgi:hypothetical protein